MADNKWSEEQPPEWTGAPIGATPPPTQWQPPTAPPVGSGASPADPFSPATVPSAKKLEVPALLRDTMASFQRNRALFLGGSFALVVFGIGLATLIAGAVWPEGLTKGAKELLSGNSALLEQTTEITDAQLAALLTDSGQVFGVLAIGITPVLLLQFFFSSIVTTIALGSGAAPKMSLGEAIKATPFVKIFTAAIAVSLAVSVGVAALLVLAVIAELLGVLGALVMIAGLIALVVVAVWFGLGIVGLNAVVIAESIGFFTAVRRSLALSKGRRWQILGAALIIGLLTSAPINVVASGYVAAVEMSFFAYYVSALLPLLLSVPATAVFAATLYKASR